MAQTELKRQIGLFSAVMLIAGDMIGTGIFISTGAIAETLPTPGGVLLVWLFGGLLALAGALTCAELAASMPYAGGDYNYIREAYGRLMGFLSGWSSFLVTFSGEISFVAVILYCFVGFFVPDMGTDAVSFSISPGGVTLPKNSCIARLGATALTRTPASAPSMAAQRVNASTPAFAAA